MIQSKANSTSPGEEQVLKILVLGNAFTGKTSLIKRYTQNIFSQQHRTTIGVDFALKIITVDNTRCNLQLWDIAGQEHFGAIQRVYYKDAVGALLVYDASTPETLDQVVAWKKELTEKVRLRNGQPVPVLLLGNKCDLESASYDEKALNHFCEVNDFIGWYATSAKNDINIDNSIEDLVQNVLLHKDLFPRQALNDASISLEQNHLGDWDDDPSCLC